MTAPVFDTRPCVLGEGPLWHPERQQLYWFDILQMTLMTHERGTQRHWQFDRTISAAGWLSTDQLLIASQTDLFLFDLLTEDTESIVLLEDDNLVTRSNDGRADPWGGFWIGTMGFHAEPGAGAIYRFYRGELRQLVTGITVSNAICFAPDRSVAYYTDTPTQQVMRVALHPDTGWPVAEPELHLDLTAQDLNPDGAVTDAAGNLWIAHWGAACVNCYAPDGTLLRTVSTGSNQTTCPAFGGADFTALYITSATVNIAEADRTRLPDTGKTFCAPGLGPGLPEPKVIL